MTIRLEVAPPIRSSAPLGAVTELCRRLTEAEVPYCHWKSNEHLRPATQGETDLDLLVARASALRVAQVLAETGYKRMTAMAARAYLGIEDYLAMDETTGKLIHLHLHYRLVLGEKFLKGYRFPWEDLLLSSRQLDRDSGLYTSAPELELIVLVVRAALKLRRRESLGFGGAGPIDADFGREFRWLVNRIEPGRLQVQATELVGSRGAALLATMLPGGPDPATLKRFRAEISTVTDSYRTYGRAEGTRRRWIRESEARWARLRSRLLRRSQLTRFSDPRGGVIIAFLGADGSGKSTVTNAIASWLSWRIEALPLYLGFGDGPVSRVRKPLQTLKSLYSRRIGESTTRNQSSSAQAPGSWRGTPKAIWRLLWSWSVVREKRGRLREAQRARNLGMVVICDRYPQAQIMALGDGPLLSHWQQHPSGWLRAAARWELEAYRQMEAVVPDLVIKLHVAPEVSARRKDDVPLDSLASRVEAVNRVQFAGTAKIVHVDANQPIEQVLLEVKRSVWEAL